MLDLLLKLSGPVGAVIAIGNIIYYWLTSGSKNNQERIDGHSKDLKDHDRRIQTLEDELQHLPTKDQFHELNISIANLSGTLNTLAERVEGIGRVVTVIDETLRHEGSSPGGDGSRRSTNRRTTK